MIFDLLSENIDYHLNILPYHCDAVVERGEERLPESPERRPLLDVAHVTIGDDDGLQDEVLLALDPLSLQPLRRQHALQQAERGRRIDRENQPIFDLLRLPSVTCTTYDIATS